jgi:hypothetical protein
VASRASFEGKSTTLLEKGDLGEVVAMSFSDATGRAIPGSQAPVPGHWPNEIMVITEFTESGGKTKVTVTEVGIPQNCMASAVRQN